MIAVSQILRAKGVAWHPDALFVVPVHSAKFTCQWGKSGYNGPGDSWKTLKME